MHQNTPQESFPPLLNIEDLARLIHRKSSTIAVDRFRRPETLPPDCTPPSQKSPVWSLTVVLEWYSSFQKEAFKKKIKGRPTKAQEIENRKQRVLDTTTPQSNN